METDAAVLREVGGEWKIERIELDPPKEHEVLVRLVASGMCHTDEHFVTGDAQTPFPFVGGHEGAGIVEEVGPGVTELQPGDHVVSSFMPSCGRCPSCVAGFQNICDRGQYFMDGVQMSDFTHRHHLNGQDLGIFSFLGTFARHTVGHVDSFVKIADDVPLDRACLVACGVTTGWGAAVYRGKVRAGDTVAVVGVGGVGTGAVQGARLAGARRIFAIDPVEFKREQAKSFGATDVASSLQDALPLIQEATAGRMCNQVIMTMGVNHGEWVADIMALVAKRGRAVVINTFPMTETSVTMSMGDLLVLEKELVGSLYGSANPRNAIPLLLDLYRDGLLDLDGMVTRTYPLEGINQGFQDMRDGKNIRGVLKYD
jgi:NDMA-dependent alcohol dehydrogenase